MLATPLDERVESPDWSSLLDRLHQSQTLAAIVIAAWQMGIYVARTLIEQQLKERAQQPTVWGQCSVCGQRLHSKGYAARQMLTIVGDLCSGDGEWVAALKVVRAANRPPLTKYSALNPTSKAQ